MVGGPCLSHEKPGCSEIVLWDMLLEIGVLFLDKIGVFRLLRFLSLTLKSRQSRQDHANGMFQLGTL